MAPPGNQAANREDKLQPIATKGPGLLDQKWGVLEPILIRIPNIKSIIDWPSQIVTEVETNLDEYHKMRKDA